MTKNVDELVLDAFLVEYPEQLEKLRDLFASLPLEGKVADDPRVREAFRLAHSFKGGARVCDLHEPEQLSHCLESLLEKICRGELDFNHRVLAGVTSTLDSIEDWMTALEHTLPLPDTSATLRILEQTLTPEPGALPPAKDRSPNTAALLPVFAQEYTQLSQRLRQLNIGWKDLHAAPDDAQLTEAAQLAHTLAGSAAIVDLPLVESAARQLEQSFRGLLAKEKSFDAECRRLVGTALDEMANAMSSPTPVPPPQTVLPHTDLAEVAPAAGRITLAEVALRADSSTPSAAAHETVRVAVESLDQLMKSSSELSIDNQQVARLTCQISALQTEVNDFDRERELIRRAAMPSIHKLASMPEFDRLSHYLEYVDRQVSSLARNTSKLSVEHRRTAWILRARCAQVQRDVYEARLVPAHSVFQGFRKMVRDLAKSEQKEIEFEAVGLDVRADRMVLQELKDSLMHVLRNCVTHGIESPEQRKIAGKSECGHIRLSFDVANGRLNVVVEDDGRGIDFEQIRRRAIERKLVAELEAPQLSNEDLAKIVFEPGFSTAREVTELAGRGMGLSIVQESIARMQGQVKLLPLETGGLQVSVSVPLFVSTHRVLIAVCGDQVIAIPSHSIDRLLLLSDEQIETVEGQPVITHERRPIRLVRLSDALGLPKLSNQDNLQRKTPVVLLKSGTRLLAVSVDALRGVRDALILNLDELAAMTGLAGGILLDDGQVALVVRPGELFENAANGIQGTAESRPTPKPAQPGRVLIVDDSFTTRTLEKSILETQGYDVSVATDGVEALSQLRQRKFGLVISDVEMPRMDGFTLLKHIRADPPLSKVPVILVTSRDRQEDQQHGREMGADAYIIKRKFDHQELLTTVRQLM